MNYIIHRTYTVLFFFIVNMEWRKKKCLLGSERVDSRLPLIQGFLELAYLSGGGPNQTERGNKFIVMRSWIQNETGAEWILIHFTGSISFPSVHGQWLHTVTPQLTCWSVQSLSLLFPGHLPPLPPTVPLPFTIFHLFSFTAPPPLPLSILTHNSVFASLPPFVTSSRGRGISWRSVAHHRPLALGN